MKKGKLNENIQSPIIPNAMKQIFQNPNAVQFRDKKLFDEFKNKQKYFSLSMSHCFYTEKDRELFHKGLKDSEQNCEMGFETGHKLAMVWDDKNKRGFIIPSNLIENELNKISKIIQEELFNILSEISPYDKHLIPKEQQLSDDEIEEQLKEKSSISAVIKDIQSEIKNKKQFNSLLNGVKFSLIEFILKYNLTDGEKTQDDLEKLNIFKLDEYVLALPFGPKDANKEYDEIKNQFISDLLAEDVLDKSDFTYLA